MLTCTCCGKGIANTRKENFTYGEKNKFDKGYGLCFECAEWQVDTFFDSRISVIKEALNEKNREKFEKMTYDQKCVIVEKMIKKGLIT